MIRSRPFLSGLVLIASVAPLRAQDGYFVTAGRMMAGTPDEATWRVTVQRDLFGPVGSELSVTALPGARPKEGELVGFGADLTLFGEGSGFPALLVGGAAGVGTNGQSRVWASSSLGLRVPTITSGALRLMLEGRWRHFTFEGRDGIELGVTLGWRTNRGRAPQPEAAGLWLPRSTTEMLRARGIPEEKARILNDVIAVAIEEMGQPYVWGGTGDGRGGFDCSGLIYYAYGKQGISIPRTSQSQARAGVAVRRDEALLLPGDILTFSDRSDQAITHVGLYVGEGRFIHSASSGVRLSRLSPEDSEGRLWLRNWVGVRRIVE